MNNRKMELKEGTKVFTASGEEVGRINRFVLDPTTNEVTHIVVQKGWLLPEDKVVPFEMISSATEDQVVLKENIEDFDNLPAFEETHFVSVEEEDENPKEYARSYDPAYYWYPPRQQGFGYLGYPAGLGYQSWPPPETETTRNIPDNTVPLKEGSNVISVDDKHVGDVERLFVEPDSGRATHFVISHGLLLKERKLVPAHWVRTVDEKEVHLTVSARLLERLPAYEEHEAPQHK
jgi:uncharacterized protein YrrD